MMVEFYDRQELSNPLNGTQITVGTGLRRIVESLRNRRPFFCELLGNNGFKLLVGIGKNVGCVQHSSSDGEPPYLMAVEEGFEFSTVDTVDFLIGSELTPVPRRYCKSMESVKQIALYFLETGLRCPNVAWEQIGATKR